MDKTSVHTHPESRRSEVNAQADATNDRLQNVLKKLDKTLGITKDGKTTCAIVVLLVIIVILIIIYFT